MFRPTGFVEVLVNRRISCHYQDSNHGSSSPQPVFIPNTLPRYPLPWGRN